MPSFTFNGFSAKAVGVSVETPRAELSDFTSASHQVGQMAILPTGDQSGGSITIEYIVDGAQASPPQLLARQRGVLLISAGNFSYAANVVCESVAGEGRVGDVFRGTLRFVPTDYYG